IAINESGVGRTPISAWMTPWQAWGLILVVPYLLVFLFFVLYPIGYGFWVARRPETYAHLFEDPIFARSVVNTLVFLIVAINLKMIVALLLSGFFVQARTWIKWLSVMCILPWGVRSFSSVVSLRVMIASVWGVVNQLIFRLTTEDGPDRKSVV